MDCYKIVCGDFCKVIDEDDLLVFYNYFCLLFKLFGVWFWFKRVIKIIDSDIVSMKFRVIFSWMVIVNSFLGLYFFVKEFVLFFKLIICKIEFFLISE